MGFAPKGVKQKITRIVARALMTHPKDFTTFVITSVHHVDHRSVAIRVELKTPNELPRRDFVLELKEIT